MKKVLIVDDNADERLVYAAILRGLGYGSLEAGDAQEGLRLAREKRPDLILMDVRLPSISGLTAVEVLKSEKQTSGIPVIAMSHADIRPTEAQLAGCLLFHPKPLSARTLDALVGSAIGAPEDDEPRVTLRS